MSSGDHRTEAISLLARHLADRYRAGERHVQLSNEAKLNLLNLRAPIPRKSPAQPVPSEKAEAGATAPTRQAPTQQEREFASQQFTRMRETLSSAPQQNSRPQTYPSRSESHGSGPATPSNLRKITPAQASGNTKQEMIRSLMEQAENCPRCKELGTLRETMVFSVGNPDADFMFVGEAPGAEEENQCEPFVGPAGKLLTKIIVAMGLDRNEVYISNICKFRPSLPNQTSNNRKPTTEEMEVCLPYILAEVGIIKPKVIIALGGTAMEGLLGNPMSVARARDQKHDFEGVPLIVTYHPSYLLRNEALSERRKVWEDMLKAMEIVGLPISEKQRGFFGGR